MAEVNEHIELVSEIPDLEKLSAQARLDRAKERRLSQLLRWQKRAALEDLDIFPPKQRKRNNRNLTFEPNITLIEAAARNDAEEVVQLINSGFSTDLQNEDGLSALHQAVIEDCEDVVHVLVDSGASLDIRDADLWTPLHAAVACGNYDLVQYLVEKGANLVAINADGNMPIDLCEDNEDVEELLDSKMTSEFTEEELDNLRNAVAEEMLNDLRDSVINGRDLSIADSKGVTAMHIAAANGYVNVLDFLVEYKAPVDMKDIDGWQPIHAAACWGQDKAIELLYQNGADLDAKTNLGESPFDLSEDDELAEMMQELKENGRKTKELKRSQSNSSRTLCVRRSSIVDKHRMSLNDAKSEGVVLQSSPDYKEVYLTSDPDKNMVQVSAPYTQDTPVELEIPRKNASDDIHFTCDEKIQTEEVNKIADVETKNKVEIPRPPSKVKEEEKLQNEKIVQPESTVTITTNDENLKKEAKKEPTVVFSTGTSDESSRTETCRINMGSAPIASKENDAPRQETQSPSDVSIRIDDSSAPLTMPDSSPNSKNTAKKNASNETHGNRFHQKECCIIL